MNSWQISWLRLLDGAGDVDDVFAILLVDVVFLTVTGLELKRDKTVKNPLNFTLKVKMYLDKTSFWNLTMC